MLGPDFFNNTSALLPVLLLTKVADRARRQANGAAATSLMSHRVFIAMALVGEGGALIGASVEELRGGIVWPLSFVVLACGYLFASELLRADAGKP